MLLERAQILDMVHQWAPGTITQYRGKIQLIRRFETTFRCCVLRSPQLLAPPITEAIPLMWAQQSHSLQRRQWTRSTAVTTPDEERITFGTVQTMRSAASLYHTWISLVEQPGQMVREHGSARPIQVGGCIPTDALEYTMMSTGMSRRLGENSNPATTLLGKHIAWIDEYLEKAYTMAVKTNQRTLARELAQAGACNLISWLAWLRGGETFGIRWQDLMIVMPGDGASHDLPAHAGAVGIKLLEQTKTNRASVADVIIAFCTASGLCVGKWILRMRLFCIPNSTLDHPSEWSTDDRLLFSHDAGRVWDSDFYRHAYLFPLLQAQRLEGDPYLRKYDGSPGHSITEAFFSMHSYRRGGRTHVSKPGARRKPTMEEINEHGRWRRRRSSESMAEQYRQWTLCDRLALTLVYM
jgi:hypothetical protein